MDWKRIGHFLKRGDHFLLSAHVNADGDAISSVLAFRKVLRRWNKQYSIVLHDETPDPKFVFLGAYDEIRSYHDCALDDRSVCFAVILDTPTLDRTGDISRLLSPEAQVLNIDHHESNQKFGTINIVKSNACATTELIYYLVYALGLEIDREMASLIYTGILFDTGRFMFSNTSKQALAICAEMVGFGARPDLIANEVYGEKSSETTRMLGQALCSLEVYMDGRVGSIYLDPDALSSGGDLDGFSDYPVLIKGVEVSVFLKEHEKNRFRVSLRSRGNVNVNFVAQTFGGGGHRNASGFWVEGSLQETKTRVLRELRKHLPHLPKEQAALKDSY